MHTQYVGTRQEAQVSVRFGLLTLLEQRPMHGYQLRQEFEASTGSTWPLNVGQVYTTLARLERDGLIEAAGSAGEDETQRSWAITEAGRTEVRSWFTTPVRHSSPPRDELAIKLAMAVRTRGVDVREVIQAQRASTMRTLQDYTRAREAAADDLSWLLVVDSLIFAAEAEVRWLDHCETRLARSQRTPPTTPPAAPTATPAADTPDHPAERKAPVR
jgi:DNA-binding PadR family transcriptional regulator